MDLETLAVRQLGDYDNHDPGTVFEDGLELSVSDAYRLQASVARLRIARGERLIGYKVGCTSPKIRAQLGIDHSIRGCLYESECYPSGTELSQADFANLAIEGELAIELSRRPINEDFDRSDSPSVVPECVERIFPVIELHHHLVRGKPSAGQLIANNAIHAGFVRGEGLTRSEFSINAAQWSLQITTNDQETENCAGSVLAETIHNSLQWLFTQEQLLSEPLRRGQIILTGSIPSLIPIQQPCRLCVDAEPFGAVSAEFTE